MKSIKGFTILFKRAVCLLLSFAAVALLSGCGSGSLPDATVPSVTGTAQPTQIPSNGHLTVSMPLHPDSLNPLDATTTEMVSLLSLIYESPIRIEADGSISPLLFSGWEKQEDGSYLFFVRENVYWHNGSALSADDIVYTLDQITQRVQSGSIYTSCLNQIQSYEKTQDGAVRILPKNGLVLLLCSLNFPVLPQAAADSALPIGTGPYKVASYTAEASMELSSNEKWWNGTPHITKISALCVKDATAAAEAFSNGETELLYTDKINAATYKQGNLNSLREVPTLYYDYLALNFSNPNLSNITIRQALAYSLDKPALITRAYSNHAVAADWPVMPASYLSDIRYSYATAGSTEIQSLLSSAGYEDRNDDGKLEDASMQPLSFTILVQSDVLDTSMEDMADSIKRQLENVGFTITIEAVAYDDYTARLAAGSFDLALVSTYLSNGPDLSSFLTDGGALNFGGYSDTQMTSLLDAVKTADESGIQDAMRAIQKKFVQELPHISLCFKTRAFVYRKTLQGVDSLADPFIFSDIASWYLSGS
jgi:peptide/nickel transport system substrate-binding protein